MTPISNPKLMYGHALPVDINEPHAQVGNHLRVNTHPSLGLPIAPFIVYRGVVDNRKNLNTRETATFLDATDNPVTLPYDVTPNKPLKIKISKAPKETCIWAQVEGFSRTKPSVSSGPISAPFVRRNITSGFQPSNFSTLPPRILRGGVRHFPFVFPPIRLLDPKPSQLRVEGFVDTVQGSATIGSRTGAPLALSAPGLQYVTITGTGTVNGFRWIEASDPQRIKYEPYAIMNLPHKGGARYLPIEDAVEIAHHRVDMQAPKRQPLQETTNTPAPEAAPVADVTYEKKRVTSLTHTLDDDLNSLIEDTGQAPLDQFINDVVTDEKGVERGEARMARISRVFQMQADPGTASLIGYKLRDDDFPETETKIVFYQIFGFFRDFPRSFVEKLLNITEDEIFDSAVAQVPIAERTMTRAEFLSVYKKLLADKMGAKIVSAKTKEMESHSEYMMLGTHAISDRAAPQDPVAPIHITKVEAREWLPATPPIARRDVRTQIMDGRIGGLLAAGKRSPATAAGTYSAINRKNNGGFHLPILLGLDVGNETSQPNSGPGNGFIADRNAGADAARYFVAQQDRFGRWSKWAQGLVDAGIRPRPPQPHVMGYYQQPSIVEAETQGGMVTVHVPIPEKSALGAASNLLQSVQIDVTGLRENGTPSGFIRSFTRPVLGKVAVSNPPNTHRVEHTFEGPILNATERQRIVIKATFIDTANVSSVESEPHRLRLNDPRPPVQPVIDKVLDYSARPDATGLSWVEYKWTPAPGQANYGIYYTDENRLHAYLVVQENTVLLTAIAAAADAKVRADLYRSNQTLFPDHLFERLKDVSVSFNSGQVGFRHAVSGSLRILNCYKIAAESEAGAKPDLGELDIILFGVPNSDPPARPTLKIRSASPQGTEPNFVAEIDITLVAGMTEGKLWRLRRTQSDTQTITSLPIVQVGPLGLGDTDTGLQTATYRDTGPVQISSAAKLKPWVRYSWVAEIQGAAESGSAAAGNEIQGRWSKESDPVSLMLVPENAPEALSFGSFDMAAAVGGGFTDVTAMLTHSDPLIGGSIGRYRLRIERKLKDDPMTILSETDVIPNAEIVAQCTVDDETIPNGTEFVLTLIDPLGRASPPLRATLKEE